MLFEDTGKIITDVDELEDDTVDIDE